MTVQLDQLAERNQSPDETNILLNHELIDATPTGFGLSYQQLGVCLE